MGRAFNELGQWRFIRGPRPTPPAETGRLRTCDRSKRAAAAAAARERAWLSRSDELCPAEDVVGAGGAVGCIRCGGARRAPALPLPVPAAQRESRPSCILA